MEGPKIARITGIFEGRLLAPNPTSAKLDLPSPNDGLSTGYNSRPGFKIGVRVDNTGGPVDRGIEDESGGPSRCAQLFPPSNGAALRVPAEGWIGYKQGRTGRGIVCRRRCFRGFPALQQRVGITRWFSLRPGSATAERLARVQGQEAMLVAVAPLDRLPKGIFPQEAGRGGMWPRRE